MEHQDRLCKAVESVLHQKMSTPKDFEMLKSRIYDRTGLLLSSTTLKRLWGYVQTDSEPSANTLNTLARFIGYSDYDSFCQLSGNDGIPSCTVVSRHINVGEDLSENERIILSWAPNRTCELLYKGQLQFVVISSENTRLLQGDTFQCSLIIEGEPLYLSQLRQSDRQPANYVCGKQGGVRFEINKTRR